MHSNLPHFLDMVRLVKLEQLNERYEDILKPQATSNNLLSLQKYRVLHVLASSQKLLEFQNRLCFFHFILWLKIWEEKSLSEPYQENVANLNAPKRWLSS